MNNLDSFIRQVLADYQARMADKTNDSGHTPESRLIQSYTELK